MQAHEARFSAGHTGQSSVALAEAARSLAVEVNTKPSHVEGFKTLRVWDSRFGRVPKDPKLKDLGNLRI